MLVNMLLPVCEKYASHLYPLWVGGALSRLPLAMEYHATAAL